MVANCLTGKGQTKGIITQRMKVQPLQLQGKRGREEGMSRTGNMTWLVESGNMSGNVTSKLRDHLGRKAILSRGKSICKGLG